MKGRCDALGQMRVLGPVLDALAEHDAAAAERVMSALAATGWSRESRVSPLSTGPEVRSLAIDEFDRSMQRMCATHTVALVIDDLHWADGATLLALAGLIRHGADLPLLMAVTLRPPPHAVELGAFVAAATRSADLGLRVTKIELTPLGPGDVADLSRTIMGERPGPNMLKLLQWCAGSPLLVTELLGSLIDAGQLHRVGKTVEPATEAASGAFPKSFTDVVQDRMARLDGLKRALAAIAALLGNRFTVADLVAATQRSAGELLPVIEELIAARVFVDDGQAMAFRHDLVRVAIARSLPASMRSELHCEIAAGLRAAGAPIVQVAEHVALGAPAGSAEAIAVLSEAAEQVAGQDPTGAVRLLRRAAELCSPTDPTRDTLFAQLVDALAWGDQIVEAESVATELLTRPIAPEAEERLRSALARSLLLLGRPGEAVGHAARIVDVNRRLGRSIAWATAQTAVCRAFALDPGGAIADAAVALETSRVDGDIMAEILALCVQTICHNALGQTETAIQEGTRAVELADRTPGREGHRLHPHLFRAIALLTAGEKGAAAAGVAHGRFLGEALGAVWALPIYHLVTALAHWDTGTWDDLLGEIEAGRGYDEVEGSTIGRLWALAVAARVHIHRGNLAEAQTAIDEGNGVLATGGPQFGADWFMQSSALLHHARGDNETALALLRVAWEAAQGLQATASLVLVAPDLARLAIEAGDMDLAHKVRDELDLLGRANPDDTLTAARAWSVRGLVDNDPDLLCGAAELLDRLQHPFEAAQARVQAADILFAAGRHSDVPNVLGDTIVRLDALQAQPDADRARGLLTDIDTDTDTAVNGGTGSAPPLTGWDALTPTEHEIAQEVCEGRSNPDVAERLGISRRTVEAHLRSIYAKVGVKSRLNLAVAWYEREGADPRPGP